MSLRMRLAAAHRADLATFRWVARRPSRMLDAFLPRLSRSADHGVLWMGVAALLAATGGRFGRRAAVRGMLSLAASSAVVNLPTKLLTRRQRPAIEVVPLARRLRRFPTSTSFPSGHTASAAAFATGAALERPGLAAPLGALATAVGVSRVYTGAHYPGDVLAGAAIGAGLALASSRLWPVTPLPREETVAAGTPGQGEALTRGEGLVMVANATAGPALGADPLARLRRDLPEAVIREVGEDDDLGTVLRSATAGARVLGIAGGDGSVNAAAAAARDAGVPLAVLPAGTLNHLARDIGVGGPADSVEALRSGATLAMDLAEIDGRPFCNAVCIGAYPELVDARERLEPRVGEFLALLLALLRAFKRSRPTRLEIDGRPITAWLVFVGNCRYEQEGIAPAWRRRLDDDLLDVRIVHADRRWARTRLLLAAATGTIRRAAVYERRLVPALRIRSLDGPLRITRDGEAFDCAEEFAVVKCAEPLTVYAPHR